MLLSQTLLAKYGVSAALGRSRKQARGWTDNSGCPQKQELAAGKLFQGRSGKGQVQIHEAGCSRLKGCHPTHLPAVSDAVDYL